MISDIDYSRKWYVMAAVAMGIFLATLDGSIVNVALPTLVRELNADFPSVQWVVLAYLLTLSTLLLTVGRLADMKGKKPIYATGFVVFTVGSVLCGLSSNVQWLVISRIFQAIGGTMILALGMAIVTEAFPPAERGKALGITGTIVSIGVVVGPTLGGIIIDTLSWHWIFFVNLPVGILGTIMALRYVPATHPTGKQRFDFIGALVFFILMVTFLSGLTLGQRIGFTSPATLGLFSISLASFLAFIRVESTAHQPMIDLRLFKNQFFSINLITGFITFIAIAGTLFLVPFYLENMLGYKPREVGLMLAVIPIAMGLIAPISGSLSDRFGTRPITVTGLIILTLGYAAVSRLGLHTNVPIYSLSFLPIGLGMGIFQSPNNSAVMGTAPRERLGIVSGMLAVMRTVGQSTGIAILGATWANRVFYHLGFTLPEGASNAPKAAQVAALQDTFRLVAFLVLIALSLSIWGMIRERQVQTRDKTQPQSFQSE